MPNPLALVFGGSRGIGAACVDKLLEDGFNVAYTTTSARLPEERAHAGRRAKAYTADIRDAAQVADAFAAARSDFGAGPSCVVACAGINVPPAPLASFDLARFRELMEVNVVGAFNVLAEAARQVAEGGSIIALTTSLVRHAAPALGPYSASKAAVESLIRSLAKELAARRVRVNAVAPGPIDTELFRAGKDDAAVQRSAAMSPFNRVGTPREVAEVVAFIASPKASWIHGQVIQPNGGLV